MIIGVVTSNRPLPDPLQYLRHTIASMIEWGASDASTIEVWLSAATCETAQQISRSLKSSADLKLLPSEGEYRAVDNMLRLLSTLVARCREIGERYFLVFHDDLEFSSRALDRMKWVMEGEVTEDVGAVTFYTTAPEC